MSRTVVWRREVIATLREHLGDDDGSLVDEIFQLYLVQARDLLAQMEDAATRLDEDLLRALAHSLKGSTATVGGDQLAAVCQRLESEGCSERHQVLQSARQEFELLADEVAHHYRASGA